MPTILFACVGSRGDVQPFVAASQGLKLQGWNPIVLCHEPFQKMVTDAGLATASFPMPANLVELFATTEAGREAKKGGLGGLGKIKSFFAPLLQQIFEATLRGVKETKADVLVLTTFPFMSGGLAIPDLCAKEGLKVRAIVAHTVPMSPSSDFAVPLAGLGLTSTFGFMNKLGWKASEAVGIGQMYGPIITPYLEKHGVTKTPKELISYTGNRNTKPATPIAYIYSPTLVPKPSDWTASEAVTGFLSIPPISSANYTPPADLAAFLSSSSLPIVYIGLGSALAGFWDTDPERVAILDKFVEAFNIHHSKPNPKPYRVILQTTTSESGKSVIPRIAPKPAGQFFIQKENLRHDWLFPQCSLLVTHGGAGSTHTCCTIGKPTLVIPSSQMNDQYFWADILRRKGVGPAGAIATKLTGAKFAGMVDDALFGSNAASYKAKAEALAKQMAGEDGVKEFVKLCQSLVI